MGATVGVVTSTDSGRRAVFTREVLAWAAWDWGSAAFGAVITTFVFTVYLTGAAFGPRDDTSSALGLGLGLAGLVIALLAPVTGQQADRGGRGTWWLGVNTAVVFVVSACLFFVRPDPAYLWLGVGLVAVGNVFNEFAGVHYNAMLPRISTPQTMGRISGIGWGAGYLGGIVLLLLLVVGFINPQVGLFGVTSAHGLDVRVSMLVAAVWLGISALPVLVVVRDRASRPAVIDAPRTTDAGSSDAVAAHLPPPWVRLAHAYRDLWHTVRDLWRTDPDTLRFLLAAAVFRDGLAGVFTFAGVVAAGTFGFSPSTVITFGIAANVVAGIATISIGVLDDRLGPKNVIVFSLVAMIAAGLGIFVLHDRGPAVFWVLGLVLAVFVGPAQSAARTFLGRRIPAGREGELFGLYATTGRAVSFLAPMLFAAAIALGQQVLAPGADAQYWGILGIALVLAVGLALLLPVRATPAETD